MRYFVILLLLCVVARAQDALTLEAVAADRSLWPQEVMVTVDHKLPVVIDGKVARVVKKGPGFTYRIKEITKEGVSVHALGSPVSFQADETDMIARAEQIRAQKIAAAAATPAPTPASQTPKSDAGAASTSPKSDSNSSRMSRTIPGSGGTSGVNNPLADLLDGQLVSHGGSGFVPYDAAQLADKKYIGIYFSASWCPPCRQFTPHLVQWYNKYRTQFNNFEVIFVSRDRDEGSMSSSMADDRMPWPAVQFSLANSTFLNKFTARGIPSFVVLDENGSLIGNSYQDGQYVGPMVPLQKLTKLIQVSR